MSPVPRYVEYEIRAGYMDIVTDDGQYLTVYGAQPRIGERFPAVVLLHDWWGLNDAVRMVVKQIAQAGFYVVAPDLFDGNAAGSAREAAALVEDIAKKRRFHLVMEAMDAMEKNYHTGHRVAVAGIGLGGGMAFRAAVQYPHKEAAVVAFNGFPQMYIDSFKNCPVPIMAIYGTRDPLIPASMIARVKQSLESATLRDQHRLLMIEGAGHELFPNTPTDAEFEHGAEALAHGIAFLNTHLRQTKK